MKHLKPISVSKGILAPWQDTGEILDQIFGFVLELVDRKGKTAEVEEG
ncbi:MAG: hypothetical protein NTZ09_16330 [Candidatus Hydrogenedentes bacterium]|nr:hypothetical protein [Candidatus Hydrogenedentota bacterium]